MVMKTLLIPSKVKAEKEEQHMLFVQRQLLFI